MQQITKEFFHHGKSGRKWWIYAIILLASVILDIAKILSHIVVYSKYEKIADDNQRYLLTESPWARIK